MNLLHQTAIEMGAEILQQQGLRVGLIITDETMTIFAPTPLLIEAGGRPGERRNAIRLEGHAPAPRDTGSDADPSDLNLVVSPIEKVDVEKACADLEANPPAKFDLARKVRVFNSRIEFVEFEVRGAALSRKTVPIPADLMGFAAEPRAHDVTGEFCTRGNGRETGTKGAGARHGRSTVQNRSLRSCDRSKSN
ncbi:MAG: hypothetical protein WBW69_10060 [Candidatus Korobacteraceae bacterium]